MPTLLSPSIEIPDYWNQAIRALSRRDPVMKKVIKSFPNSVMTSRGDPFTTLIRSIVGQQISVKAADAVWGRMTKLCQGRDAIDAIDADNDVMTPAGVLLQEQSLRACGLSARKVQYVVGVAHYFAANPRTMAQWRALNDEQVIIELTALYGIGRWSAEMFLMFTLLRPNILPLDDIGLLRGIGVSYLDGVRPTRQQVKEIAANWTPWCSVATWFMWRAIDPSVVAY